MIDTHNFTRRIILLCSIFLFFAAVTIPTVAISGRAEDYKNSKLSLNKNIETKRRSMIAPVGKNKATPTPVKR
jgi:hypothetical protein